MTSIPNNRPLVNKTTLSTDSVPTPRKIPFEEAVDITKAIIEINDPRYMVTFLSMIDFQLTGKRLEAYEDKRLDSTSGKQKLDKDKKISSVISSLNLVSDLNQFLINANTVNPYAQFVLQLSDNSSKLIIKVDNKRVTLELVSNIEEVKRRYQELLRKQELWKETLEFVANSKHELQELTEQWAKKNTWGKIVDHYFGHS